MKKPLLILIFAMLTFAQPSFAGAPSGANGGGQGTVDGTKPFSQFGFGVTKRADGSVRGSFNCLMAGASQFPGFTLMAVRGQVTAADINGDTATFDGAGMFQTGPDGKLPSTFHVEVTAGGPGVGTLKLTLWTPFFFPLPIEHVMTGQIRIS